MNVMKLTKEMKKAFQTPQVKPIQLKLSGLKKSPGLSNRVALDFKVNTKTKTAQLHKPKLKGGRSI